MKNCLVLGGNGFIGGHLVKKLTSQGAWVRVVDLVNGEYGSSAQEVIIGDLTDFNFMRSNLTQNQKNFDEIYQLAADMGGAGYIFSGEHDASVMSNSANININLLRSLIEIGGKYPKVFYSSSACVYPEYKQNEPNHSGLRETDAYPAQPDSEYGWEKLFSERLFKSFQKNYGIPVRIARFHNIFGPEGKWQGGREKAPAAICRKIVVAKQMDSIEIWGDGNQTRSFLYIEDCLEAIDKLMKSDCEDILNIGSTRSVSINELVGIVAKFENKEIKIIHLEGPQGVRGRNSNNERIKIKLNWEPKIDLENGLEKTYFWIKKQLQMI